MFQISMFFFSFPCFHIPHHSLSGLVSCALASRYDVDQSTDLWLASCLNDTDINYSQDDVYVETHASFLASGMNDHSELFLLSCILETQGLFRHAFGCPNRYFRYQKILLLFSSVCPFFFLINAFSYLLPLCPFFIHLCYTAGADFWNDQVNSDDRGQKQISQPTQKIVFRGSLPHFSHFLFLSLYDNIELSLPNLFRRG